MSREAIVRLREEASARIESDPQGALSRFQYLLKIDPADMEAWSACAGLHMRLGQTEAAAEGFTRVLRLAERANSSEWASYAQRSLAHLKQGASTQQSLDHAPGGSAVANAAPPQTRPTAPGSMAGDAIAQNTANVGSGPGAIASAVASATLACVAGVGFLLLVTTGAVSQLWGYPFVRAGLLRAIDDLTAATLLGYFGSIVLQKAWSHYLIGRALIYVAAGVLLSGAIWFTLSGLMPLSGLFAECANIEDIKPACNIQIEELQKMTPETRKQLNVL